MEKQLRLLPIVFVSLFALKAFVFGAYLADTIVLAVFVAYAVHTAKQHKKTELDQVREEVASLKASLEASNAAIDKLKTQVGTTKLGSVLKG